METASRENFLKLRSEQLPWTEKHRPNRISSLILDTNLEKKLNKIIEDRNIPNLIFSGSPGTGKTTSSRSICKQIYGKYYSKYVLELNASDDRGARFVQNNIVAFCKTSIHYSECDKDKYPKQKVIILDEADNMLDKAQHKINVLISQFNANTRFIFTCNDSTKIIESIHSHCQILNFSKLTQEQIINRLEIICKYESLDYTHDALDCVASRCNGDMRLAINMTQLISIRFNKINLKNANETFDMPQPEVIKNIFQRALNTEYSELDNLVHCLQEIKQLRHSGFSTLDIIFGMFFTLKTSIVTDIEWDDIIKITDIVTETALTMSYGAISDLQLDACIVKLTSINF